MLLLCTRIHGIQRENPVSLLPLDVCVVCCKKERKMTVKIQRYQEKKRGMVTKTADVWHVRSFLKGGRAVGLDVPNNL